MKLEPEPKMLDFQCSVIPGCWSSARRDLPCCSALGWVSSSWDSWLLLHLQHLQHTTSLEAWPAPTALQFSSVQSLSCVQLFVTPWNTARQASLSITNSRSPPKLMSIESVMPSNHLILCHPLLLLPSIFPSIRVFFSNESVFCTHINEVHMQTVLMLSHFSCVWLFVILSAIARQAPLSLCPWDSPGKNTGVGCHFFLQEIFLTHRLNPCLLCLLHWQAGSLTLMPPGKPARQISTKGVYIWQGRFSLIFSLLLPQHLLPTKLVCFSWVIVILCSAFCYYTNKIFCQ